MSVTFEWKAVAPAVFLTLKAAPVVEDPYATLKLSTKSGEILTTKGGTVLTRKAS